MAKRKANLILALTCASAAYAGTFGSGANAFDIRLVTIGNPGNPADTRYAAYHNFVGSVAYTFRIGQTEITNAQYAAFLNAVAAADPYGLYNTEMSNTTWGGIDRSGVSGSFSYQVKAAAQGGTYLYDDKPVVFVSSGDAMRFANWLHNGQPSGPQNGSTTEDGAYTLNGAVTNEALAAVARNAGARWWLPSDDEWYKAAYHKNDGVTGNYWDFPTATNSVSNNNQPQFDTGNSANFWGGRAPGNYTTGDFNFPMTDAGAYTLSVSPYGTFDQGGNVREWNDTLFDGYFRSTRGGCWDETLDSLYARDSWAGGNLTGEHNFVGFRVASIPEPNSIWLGASASLAFLRRIDRSARRGTALRPASPLLCFTAQLTDRGVRYRQP